MSEQRPIFLPLKRAFFEAFENGEKDTEYRLHGPRWNGSVITPGRAVTLSLGYSGRRRNGVVKKTWVDTNPKALRGWKECYPNSEADAFCFQIELI